MTNVLGFHDRLARVSLDLLVLRDDREGGLDHFDVLLRKLLLSEAEFDLLDFLSDIFAELGCQGRVLFDVFFHRKHIREEFDFIVQSRFALEGRTVLLLDRLVKQMKQFEPLPSQQLDLLIDLDLPIFGAISHPLSWLAQAMIGDGSNRCHSLAKAPLCDPNIWTSGVDNLQIVFDRQMA